MNFRHANLILLALLNYAAVDASAQSLARISVTEDRPLMQAARELSKQLGVAITVEEMQFEHPDDFKEVEWRSQTLTVPRFGEFNFEYAPTTPESEIVHAMLDSYHESFPGNYKLIEETLETDEEEATIFHIVPDASKDASGTYVPRQSVLEIPLTFDVTNATTVEEIVCDVVEQAAAMQTTSIGCHTDFAPQLGRTMIDEYHGDDVAARTHLVRLLNETGTQITWTLLRSAETGAYGIHFYTVAP